MNSFMLFEQAFVQLNDKKPQRRPIKRTTKSPHDAGQLAQAGVSAKVGNHSFRAAGESLKKAGS